MKIAINTLWLKHKKVGGIESYLFNLLDGIKEVDKKNYYLIISTRENYKLFRKYKSSNVEIIQIDIDSNNILKRILWENLYLYKIAIKNNADIMFNPVYSKPIINNSKIGNVTTIHDLQALHFPEYFSKKKILWLKFAWKRAVNSSDKVIAISDFSKFDIIKRFNVNRDNITRIYNPINVSNYKDNDKIFDKLNIKKNNYLYTVSSMFKHKNLITLLKTIKNLKKYDENIKLVISGISDGGKDEFIKEVKKLNIEKNIIITGFVDNSTRDSLYKNCSIFLFPSIFEGFGMPPIEAMLYGKKVLTTKESCIEEVTKGLANYVDDPYDIEEWTKKILELFDMKEKTYKIIDYEVKNIALQYINVFEEVYKKRRDMH